MKSFLLSVALFTCYFSGAVLAVQPNKLIFCHEDENAFPWVFDQKKQLDGLDIRLVKLLESDLGIEITLLSLPWKRCLLHLKNGVVDGAFAASFSTDRLTMGVYPMTANNKLDASKRIHISSYYLYTPIHSKLTWNGQGFSNLSGNISVQLGFSISEKLTQIGVPVNEVKGPQRALKDVLDGVSQGAVLQAERADYILLTDPIFHHKIKKHKVALTEKPYYLMLSFNLASKYPVYTQYIWQRLVFLRDSKMMKSASHGFWQER